MCHHCWRLLEPIQGIVCSRCGGPFVSAVVSPGGLCGACRRSLHELDYCRSFGIYENPLREVLHWFKYGRRRRLGKRLAALLRSKYSMEKELAEADLILPIPLHRRRRQARGFNQSEILARPLSKISGVHFEGGVLARTRDTRSQTGLTRRQRRLNLSRAFLVRKPHLVRGKTCLIIDDVMTTGATLNEAASALKACGAKKVMALTLARVSSRQFRGQVPSVQGGGKL